MKPDEEAIMKVSKADAVKLFVALGYKAAATKWSDEKITEHLNKLPEIVESEGMDGVQDNAELKKLLNAVCKKVNADEEIELDAGKAKPAAKDEDGDEDAPKKKASKKEGPKKVGVIASIIEFLGKASAKKPLSKADLAEKLSEKFPDKEKNSMASTINVQVPNRIRKDKGIEVSKNENGYWIDQDELAKLKG